MKPRITIITFAWPPRNSIGAHRPYSWAKYWSAQGAQVRVITAKKYAYDAPLDLELPTLEGVEVIEVDYQKSGNRLASMVYNSPFRGIALSLWRRLRGVSTVVRNPREGWLTACLPFIDRWAQETDFVISTYDPKMVHQIASRMKQANPALHWTADYRDLWSLNHAPAWTDAQRAAERKMEMDTVQPYADLVTSVSEELACEQGELLGKPWEVVTNGFDIDAAELRASLARPLNASSVPLRIVYTGKIYKGLRDPLPLLEVLVSLEDSGQLDRGSVQVDIYGGQTDGIDHIMETGRFDHIVNLHGHVQRDVALVAQREADLLLLLESPLPDAAGVLTGKIFEYMSTGNPILSLGSRQASAIGKILAKTSTGICTEDEPELIAQVVLTRMEGRSPDGFDPQIEEILAYSRENQAMHLMAVMTNTEQAMV